MTKQICGHRFEFGPICGSNLARSGMCLTLLVARGFGTACLRFKVASEWYFGELTRLCVEKIRSTVRYMNGLS